MPQYQPLPGIGGNIPADQIPAVEAWANQSGYTLGMPSVSGSSTPFAGILGDQSGTYLGDALKGLQGWIDTIGQHQNPLTGPVSGVENAAGNAAKDAALGAVSWLFSGRVAAIGLGIILIIAGLFLLSKGPAVNIITRSAKQIATGA